MPGSEQLLTAGYILTPAHYIFPRTDRAVDQYGVFPQLLGVLYHNSGITASGEHTPVGIQAQAPVLSEKAGTSPIATSPIHWKKAGSDSLAPKTIIGVYCITIYR